MEIPFPAMILAAGRGTRLAAWTEHTPKPLVPVAGTPVIFLTLQRLAWLGFRRVVINAHHLGAQLREQVGDGQRWGVQIQWSMEPQLLETGGGVCQALPLLDAPQFLVVNGDVVWDLDLRPLLEGFDPRRMDALLGLVENPAEGVGDFVRDGAGCLQRGRGVVGSWTYSGIQILARHALQGYAIEPFSLNRVYDAALAKGRLQGVPLRGFWADMGTPERLAQTEKHWREHNPVVMQRIVAQNALD
ncbi:Nucleotidyl transferase [Magnetococcus marinus MC-1]|uniref:Nucleotidyl transferase n=1 Tax=Magnetococcus marinus (strain ATCC BAA-1437 / JCM 17883 / MC-1) TaxID=156889 RepID=A0L688_MAGMM|nr:nucleotidyltransferase family protein [Magnetococcus marinus]ABK43481.1 Nucleotidyl transferase [Magnetococcus marinus MC-1]